MVKSLFDQTVASTYKGVLHAEGAALPSTGIQQIYDGAGQPSALSMGTSGNGADIAGGLSLTGKLTAGQVEYTNVDSASGEGFTLVTDGQGRAFFGQFIVDAMRDLEPSPEGTYTQIDTITVNSKGLVTDVNPSPIRECWVNFDGQPITDVLYEVSPGVPGFTPGEIACVKDGHGLASGQIVNLTASDVSLNGAYPVTVFTDSQFTIPLPLNYVASAGTLTISTTIRSAYNVSKVNRDGAGRYSVFFTDTYNNNMYMTQVSKGTHIVPATNPERVNGNSGWSIVTKQMPTYVSVYSQSGDCVNMNVLTKGNTLIYQVDTAEAPSNYPLLYTNYRYYDGWLNYEQNEASFGGCTMNTPVDTFTIDADYMAQNKLIAFEVLLAGADWCRGGFYSANYLTSVVDAVGTVHNSKFLVASTTPEYNKKSFGIRTIILLIGNKLYYKTLYGGRVFDRGKFVSIVDPNYDLSSKFVPTDGQLTAGGIVPSYPRKKSTFCGFRNMAGVKTTTSYITPIIQDLGFDVNNPAAFRQIRSAVISVNFTSRHTGDCVGGFSIWKERREFYLNQP